MMTVVIVVVNYLPAYHTGTSNQQKKLKISWKSLTDFFSLVN